MILKILIFSVMIMIFITNYHKIHELSYNNLILIILYYFNFDNNYTLD